MKTLCFFSKRSVLNIVVLEFHSQHFKTLNHRQITESSSISQHFILDKNCFKIIHKNTAASIKKTTLKNHPLVPHIVLTRSKDLSSWKALLLKTIHTATLRKDTWKTKMWPKLLGLKNCLKAWLYNIASGRKMKK